MKNNESTKDSNQDYFETIGCDKPLLDCAKIKLDFINTIINHGNMPRTSKLELIKKIIDLDLRENIEEIFQMNENEKSWLDKKYPKEDVTFATSTILCQRSAIKDFAKELLKIMKDCNYDEEDKANFSASSVKILMREMGVEIE